MTTSMSRRRLLGGAAATAAGLLFAGETSAASATTDARRPAGAPLPIIGQTLNLSMNAFGTTLHVPDLAPPMPKLDLVGAMTVKILVGGMDFVRMQILDFTMVAAHPLYERVTLHLPDTEVSPASTLKVLSAGNFLTHWLLSFNATFERNGKKDKPFTYTTLSPASLIGRHHQFPPPPQGTKPNGSPTGGDLLLVQAPVSLGTVDAAGKGTEHFQLRGMNINIGRLI